MTTTVFNTTSQDLLVPIGKIGAGDASGTGAFMAGGALVLVPAGNSATCDPAGWALFIQTQAGIALTSAKTQAYDKTGGIANQVAPLVAVN